MMRSILRTAFLLVLVTAALSTAGNATAAPEVASTAAWDPAGPSDVAVKVELQTTFYYPKNLKASPGRHAVVLWGNGSGGVPAVYDALLRHWASYGFIVAAANTPVSNTGWDMLAGLDTLQTANGNRGSEFYDEVDSSNVIAAGHSQGGSGAINAGADSRVTSVLALQPGPLADVRRLHSPLLLLTGSTDLIVPPNLYVRPIFYPSAQVPTVYGCLRGAGHFASVLTGDGGVWRGVTTAWLLDAAHRSSAASAVFHSPTFTLASDPRWVEVQRNRAALSWE